jgi:hypothetical protein
MGKTQCLQQHPFIFHAGSEDAHMPKGLRADLPLFYNVCGLADPKVFSQARKEGKCIPYSAHNPDFIVDLAAIPVGVKVATTSVLGLLVRGKEK